MKYLISLFMFVACCLQQCCWAQSTTVRPYKFGFTIDEQQHRSESRDERGIVMGEFGFITADGIYHVTVYATDEQGRFRILAMRNYPYESPPKTVEVMVQPKIAPTTTTTAKPLAKHNFNTEACSGCFLTNGNNKPKGLNGIESKTVKNDIRPLSKSLPSPSANAAANPKIPNKNVGAGKLYSLNGENVLLTFNANKKPIKLNTPVTENVAFKDLVELQNAVKNQQLFSTTPSSVAPSRAYLTPNNINTKPLAIAAPKVDMTLSTFVPSVSILALNKFVSTPSNLTPNTEHTNPPIFAPTKFTTTVANKQSSEKHTTPKTKISEILLNDKNKSITKTLQNPLRTQQQLIKSTPTQPNAPYVKQQYQMVALSLVGDKDTNKAIINNNLKPLKTKTIQFLKHDLNLPTKTAAQENTLTKTPTKNTLEPPFEGNLNTDTTAQANTLTQTPLKSSVGSVEEPASQGKDTQLKLMLEQPKEYKVFPQASANPATLNKNSGKQPIQTPPNTNTLNKQYTTSPTVSQDTNQQTTKPLAGSPGSAGTAKTNTGNPPPIMDIIMQKVLPAIMGKTPSGTPTQTTTLNKPNVPSGKKPSSTSGSSSTSANGDGDLYRFKYILDYHGHTETGKRNGNKEGSYYAIGDDDVERTIEYVANENGYQPRIRWRKLDRNEIKSKENTLKDYEFVWFNQ
ncbi:protein lethal(3)malignant blood neoplasm 1 isoform X2 [Lucilia sericata]|uniref:protein lethal(3)malignant blood neoplasm 1 isoform X2 n=1 Tax=Lucilia sericata TaxID=13632 RepID=UPI0018A7ECFF|nr:protein lethal(3)malignant blood neoplasm 1 isoform X2 [Lucilia sericata]